MNYNPAVILAFILSLNVIFFIAQVSVDKINPEDSTEFFNYSGSMIKQYDLGGYVLNESLADKLPESSNAVQVEEGNIFTDIFKTFKNWFAEKTGLNYLWNVVNAFPNFLKIMGLPIEIVFALGFFWHALTLFVFISLITGRNT